MHTKYPVMQCNYIIIQQHFIYISVRFLLKKCGVFNSKMCHSNKSTLHILVLLDFIIRGFSLFVCFSFLYCGYWQVELIWISGTKGAKGEVGPKGQLGRPGNNGTTGQPGRRGSTGPRGIPGSKGEKGGQHTFPYGPRNCTCKYYIIAWVIRIMCILFWCCTLYLYQITYYIVLCTCITWGEGLCTLSHFTGTC